MATWQLVNHTNLKIDENKWPGKSSASNLIGVQVTRLLNICRHHNHAFPSDVCWVTWAGLTLLCNLPQDMEKGLCVSLCAPSWSWWGWIPHHSKDRFWPLLTEPVDASTSDVPPGTAYCDSLCHTHDNYVWNQSCHRIPCACWKYDLKLGACQSVNFWTPLKMEIHTHILSL